MSNQLDLYIQSLQEQKAKEEEQEEQQSFYTSTPETPEGYETFVTEPTTEREVNPYDSTPGKTTLTELRNDPEFAQRASRFLDGVGSNDNIFEYLRDSDYSLSAAAARSFQAGKWTDEQKQDYTYLRERFNNADIGNWKERFGMIKDIGVDIVTDPFNIAAAIFAIPSGGTSAGTRVALGTAAKQAIKQKTKAELKTKAIKDTALFTAAEGAAWGGLHNYFLQDIDMDLGLQDDIDFTNIAATTLLGGAIGGALGGGITAATYGRGAKEVAKKVDTDVDTVPVTDMPEPYQQLEFKFSNEEVIEDVARAKTRKEILEESEAEEVLVEPLEKLKDKGKKAQSKGTVFLHKFIANTVGKPTTEFLSYIDKSPQLQALLKKFRYDYDVTLTGEGSELVKEKSYGLAVGERTGKYLYGLAKSFNVLDRVGFRARLAKDQQKELNFLLRDKMVVSTKQEAQEKGKFWIRDLVGKDYKGIKVTEDVAVSYGGKNFDGTEGVRNILDGSFSDLSIAGLFKAGTINKGGFLPRLFNYKALKKNRERFQQDLIDAGHANPINDIDEITIKTSDNVKVQGIKEDAVGLDEEIFGVNFLKLADGDETLAKQLKASRIVDDMLEQRWTPFEVKMMTKEKVVGDSAGYLQARRFTNLDDNKIAYVLEDDTQQILEDYFTNAARAIERSNYFGRNIAEFEKNSIIPIRLELLKSGMSENEVTGVLDGLRNMHKRVTGIETDSQSMWKKKGWARNAADWGKLIQQMAHLPLATLSSVTEPFLLLSRAGKSDAPKVISDIGNSIVKEGASVMDRTIKGFQRGVLRQRVKGIKDIDDEAWGELYQTGLALEQAVQERLEGLAGEGLHGSVAKNLQQGFFKVNLLTQWTRAVQLASFTTGKRLIKQNAEKLSKGGLGKSKREYLTKQLGGLGVKADDAVAWYKKSTVNGKWDENIARSQEFYQEQYTSGANRFVKEIILNPSTAEANRPLWFSTPAAQMLIQFAGYPTVFTNTILKRFSYEAVNSPMQSIPKVLPTVILMSSVAHIGNYVRSQGNSLKDYETGRDKDAGELIFESVRRWGGLGFFDYVSRYDNEYERNVGSTTAALKTFAGPLPQDLIDTILYRKGIPEVLVTNLPGYSAYDLMFGEGTKKSLRAAARGTSSKDEEYKVRQYSKGGIVLNVPNVKDEPDEMINRNTGLPFNATSEAAQDIEDRELKAQMEGLGLREPYMFGGLAMLGRKNLMKLMTQQINNPKNLKNIPSEPTAVKVKDKIKKEEDLTYDEAKLDLDDSYIITGEEGEKFAKNNYTELPEKLIVRYSQIAKRGEGYKKPDIGYIQKTYADNAEEINPDIKKAIEYMPPEEFVMMKRNMERLNKYSEFELKQRQQARANYWEMQKDLMDARNLEDKTGLEDSINLLETKSKEITDFLKTKFNENPQGISESDYKGLGIYDAYNSDFIKYNEIEIIGKLK